MVKFKLMGHEKAPEILTLVANERNRQDDLWGWPQNNTLSDWICIITEEVGELAQEALRCHFESKERVDLITEAIQVAACAISLVEHCFYADPDLTESIFNKQLISDRNGN